VRFQGLCLTARIRFVSIFVGNLPFRAEQEDVAELFSPFGEIVNCALPLERDTGRKRGFAFVEMADSDAEDRAIEALQGAELMGRPLRINKAEPRGAAPRRGGGGGGYSGGGSGGGGGNRDRAPGSRGWEDRSYGGPGAGSDSAFEAGRTRRRRSGSSDSYGGAEG
jgi:RNA recognition motif-containing protein